MNNFIKQTQDKENYQPPSRFTYDEAFWKVREKQEKEINLSFTQKRPILLKEEYSFSFILFIPLTLVSYVVLLIQIFLKIVYLRGSLIKSCLVHSVWYDVLIDNNVHLCVKHSFQKNSQKFLNNLDLTDTFCYRKKNKAQHYTKDHIFE